MQVFFNSGEKYLIDMIGRIKSNRNNCYAVYFHLSELEERHRSEFQIRVATNILNDIFRKDDGSIFIVNESDLVLLYIGFDESRIEKAIYQLRYLFSDDPLAYVTSTIENENFADVFFLRYQWREFYNFVKNKLKLKTNDFEEISDNPTELTPIDLVNISHELEQLEVSHLMRTQAVCARTKGGKLKPIFYEYFISMSHLKQTLDLNVNLNRENLLFRYLMKIMDEKILELLLLRNKHIVNGPIGLNLHVSSVFSDSFLQLDELIEQNHKSNIVVEFHFMDIFEDLARFEQARNYLHNRGYKICLDGLDHLSLNQINRERLGLDLAKLTWNAELEAMAESNHELLIDSLNKFGLNRLILNNCDNKYIVSYGNNLGISIFQGWHIDKQLKLDIVSIS